MEGGLHPHWVSSCLQCHCLSLWLGWRLVGTEVGRDTPFLETVCRALTLPEHPIVSVLTGKEA